VVRVNLTILDFNFRDFLGVFVEIVGTFMTILGFIRIILDSWFYCVILCVRRL
jgi:hypothetical protein